MTKLTKFLREERGYALIEAVFLVSVIAILFSILVPKISASLRTVQADYFMKSLYSELRFIQAARRLIPNDEDIFNVKFSAEQFLVTSTNQNIRLKINNEIYRKYKMPSNFHFEKDFSMFVTSKGILKNSKASDSTSDTIKLKTGSTTLKPSIVYDSVGRFRFDKIEK